MPHDHPVFKVTDRNDPITDAYILGIYEKGGREKPSAG